MSEPVNGTKATPDEMVWGVKEPSLGSRVARWSHEHEKSVALSAGLVVLALSSIYLWIWTNTPSKAVAMIIAYIPSLVAAPVVSVLTYVLLRGVRELHDESQREAIANAITNKIGYLLMVKQTTAPWYTYDWRPFLRDARTIDIVVHYFDSWISNHVDEFAHFFANGGKLRMILPNPDNAEMIRWIRDRFPGLQDEDVAAKIRKTKEALEGIYSRSKKGRPSLQVQFVDRMIWYCGILRNEEVVALSPFEHDRFLRVQSPVFVFATKEHPQLSLWFRKEWDYLQEGAI